MDRPDSRLLRHLTIAVVVKLAVLVALWWVFVRDLRIPVDGEAAAAHLAAPAGTTSASPGDPR